MIKICLGLFIGFVICQNAAGQSGQLNWQFDYEDALAKTSSDRPLLVSFAGSDWCKPCIMLTREIFETDEFRSYAQENLVLVMADFPRLKKNKLTAQQAAENEKLAELYNKEGSFPLVVLVDGNEKVIGKLGYTTGGPNKFIEKIESLVSSK